MTAHVGEDEFEWPRGREGGDLEGEAMCLGHGSSGAVRKGTQMVTDRKSAEEIKCRRMGGTEWLRRECQSTIQAQVLAKARTGGAWVVGGRVTGSL